MLTPRILLPDLAVLLAVGLLGALLAKAVLGKLGTIETVALSFPLGAGALTFGVFLVTWAGAPIGLALFAVVYIALAAVFLWVGKLQHVNQQPRASIEDHLPNAATDTIVLGISLAIFAGLVILAAYISIGRSHSNYDAVAMWITKGYGFAKEKSLSEGAAWGAHGLSYPLNIQLLVSLFRLTGGDRLPGSQLIFTSFQASAVLGCCAFWLRRGVRRWLAGLGLVFMASVPVLFLHATIGFANLAMGLYVALGTAYAIEGIIHRDRRSKLLGGLLLGFGSWTILEGMLFSLICLLVLVLGWLKLGRPGSIRHLTLPALATTGIWLSFYLSHGASGSQASGTVQRMLEAFGRGEFNLVELRLIFGYARRYLFHPDLWGLLFFVAPVLLVLNWKGFVHERRNDLVMLGVAAVATGLLSCGLFYLRSFQGLDLLAWLIRGFPRQFLGTALLFGILALLPFSPYQNNRRRQVTYAGEPGAPTVR